MQKASLRVMHVHGFGLIPLSKLFGKKHPRALDMQEHGAGGHAVVTHQDHKATAQWAVELLASRRYKQYLQVTKSGMIRIDRGAIRQAAKYDGKGCANQRRYHQF